MKDAMPATAYLSLGSTERENVGVIVTARELQTGERIVLHEKGTTSDALRAVCQRLDRLGGDWRVLALATPATIYRDLQGTRLTESRDSLDIPERPALAKIGRLDRLDPSLLPVDTSTRRRFRDTWRGVWQTDPDRDVRQVNKHRHLNFNRDNARKRDDA